MAQVNLPPKMYGFPPEAFDWSRLPDVDTNFLPAEDLEAFIQALSAPDPVQSPDDASSMRLGSPTPQSSSSLDVAKRPPAEDEAQVVAAHAAAAAANIAAPPALPAQGQLPPPNRSNSNLFISAQSDWAPVHEKVHGSGSNNSIKRTSAKRYSSDLGGKKRRRRSKHKLVGQRTRDETREGYLYGLLKWPFLLIVGAWIVGLALTYVATRSYIYLYEQFVAWRGTRERLRRAMRATGSYKDWVAAAQKMDDFLGNTRWREDNEFAYYDSKTVRRVWDQMRKCRIKAEEEAGRRNGAGSRGFPHDDDDDDDRGQKKAVEDLKALIEACVKNNFVGVENPRLYSQTYYGTKNMVQNWVDEGELWLTFCLFW